MIAFPERQKLEELPELQAKMTMLLRELATECREYLSLYAALENAKTPEELEDAEIGLTVFASQLASTTEQIELTDVQITDAMPDEE
jgi:hypothetical protein